MIKILYIGNQLSGVAKNPTTIDVLADLLGNNGFTVKTASKKSNLFFRLLDMILMVIKHRNFNYLLIDVYSTKAFWFAFFCSQLARFFKLKYITILHGGDLPKRLKKNAKLSKLIFKNAYQIVSPSGYLKNSFETFGFKNIIEIPNPINTNIYPFKTRTIFTPNILWVRAFHEIYNPKMAVLVFADIKKIMPNATLTMVGADKDGSLKEVKLLAQQFNLNINFTGQLKKEEWIDLAKNHDVFINTSNIDNTPVSVIEAMLLGLPIVSTNVGGIPYIITDEFNGLLVNANQIDLMVQKIKLLIDYPIKTQQITTEAYQFAQQASFKKVLKKWVHLLK